jgi:glycine/D-amino acid oxidase-like deaminating enzyme
MRARTFRNLVSPVIMAAGESIGVSAPFQQSGNVLQRTAHFSASSLALQPRLAQRNFHSSVQRRLGAAAHSVRHEYSPSIYQFLDDVSKHGRYAPATQGFTWKTPDSKLSDLVTKHFPEAINTFAIKNENTKATPPTVAKTKIKKGKITASVKELPVVSSVSAGGLPALWVAYMQSLLFKTGVFPKNIAPPVYVIPDDMENSAAFGSSTQFHVSHAAPMYTDPAFSTARILWASIKRNMGWGDNSPERDNYMIGEIHPAAFFNPTVINVGLGYLYHEWRYTFGSVANLKTILDETIPLAIASGNVMDNVSAELGQKILLRKNTIRVAYDKAETKEMLELQKQLKEYGIECTQVSKAEVLSTAGVVPKIGKDGSIWTIKGDGNLVPNVVEILVQGIQRNGGTVIRGMVSDIHYSREDNQIFGVTVKGQNSETFVRSDRLFTSFGARGNYVFEDRSLDAGKIEPIISGTGFSAFLVVEGEIKQPIDSNNSHFTPLKTVTIADGKKITLVKATCGGAIGSDSFCVDHAINNLFYATHIIFPNKKVEIFAGKSCPRPLNKQNSGRLIEALPGFFIGSGFGGKGVTDAAGVATTGVLEKLTRGLVEPQIAKSFVERYVAKPAGEKAVGANFYST